MPRLYLAAMLLLGGCSEAVPVAGDAEVDAGVDSATPDSGPAPVEPSPVAAPAPPVMAPCPAGWREVEGPDFTECDPWPAAGREVCGPGEAHFLGEASCRRIGAPCPPDGMPAGLPVDAVYVRPGTTGGDGTRAAPFATIAEALAVAGTDTVIGLAVGTYGETTIARETTVSIVGACTDAIIEPPEGTGFVVAAGTLRLRNLSIRNATRGVLARDAVVSLDSIIFDDLDDTALTTTGGTTTDARDLLIRGADRGGFLIVDSSATLNRVSIEDAGGYALAISASRVEATALSVDGSPGSLAGFLTAAGAEVVIEASVLASEPLASIIAVGSSLRLADTICAGRPGDSDPAEDVVILAMDESHLDLERVTLTNPKGLAIGIAGAGTDAIVRDVVLREVLGFGHGIEVGDGARADLGRLWVERAGRNAVLVFGEGTEVVARDLRVRSSVPDIVGHWGRGIGVQTGASLMADRVALEDLHEVSLVVASPGTAVRLFDLAIRTTRIRPCVDTGCPAAGIGLGAYLGGSVRVERFRLEDNGLAGVQAATEGHVELVDGVVSGNPVGANIQNVDYDIDLLTDRVTYRENGQNLDSTALFVPVAMVP